MMASISLVAVPFAWARSERDAILTVPSRLDTDAKELAPWAMLTADGGIYWPCMQHTACMVRPASWAGRSEETHDTIRKKSDAGFGLTPPPSSPPRAQNRCGFPLALGCLCTPADDGARVPEFHRIGGSAVADRRGLRGHKGSPQCGPRRLEPSPLQLRSSLGLVFCWALVPVKSVNPRAAGAVWRRSFASKVRSSICHSGSSLAAFCPQDVTTACTSTMYYVLPCALAGSRTCDTTRRSPSPCLASPPFLRLHA